MKRLFVMTALVLFAMAAGAAELEETIDRTFNVRPGASVILENVNGGVRITSWSQPRVRVIARKEVHASRSDVKDVLRELRVEMQPHDGGLVIKTDFPRKGDGFGSIFDWLLGNSVSREVTYELTVPKSMNIEVSNTNGSIKLTEVNGVHELGTTNGRIEVRRCAGALDASTTNGSIYAELLTVNKGEALSFHTTNGRIEIEVPSNLAVDLDAGTTNGSIKSDLPVTTRHLSRNSLRGTINGGGTPLRMRTTNGGIAIRTAGAS